MATGIIQLMNALTNHNSASQPNFSTVSGITTTTRTDRYSKKIKETLNSFDKMLDAIAKQSKDFSILMDQYAFGCVCNEVGVDSCKLGMDLLVVLYSKNIPQKFFEGMKKTEKAKISIAVKCKEILVNELGMNENFAVDVLYILEVKMKF